MTVGAHYFACVEVQNEWGWGEGKDNGRWMKDEVDDGE